MVAARPADPTDVTLARLAFAMAMREVFPDREERTMAVAFLARQALARGHWPFGGEGDTDGDEGIGRGGRSKRPAASWGPSSGRRGGGDVTDLRREILLYTLGLYVDASRRTLKNYWCVHPPNGSPYHDAAAAEIAGMIDEGLMERYQEAGDCYYVRATARGVQAAIAVVVPMAEIEAWLETGEWAKGLKRRGQVTR